MIVMLASVAAIVASAQEPYEKILLLYNDATSPVAEVISTYVYKKGLIEQNYSFSAAVGLFNSTINLALIIITNRISKKTTEIGLW